MYSVQNKPTLPTLINISKGAFTLRTRTAVIKSKFNTISDPTLPKPTIPSFNLLPAPSTFTPQAPPKHEWSNARAYFTSIRTTPHPHVNNVFDTKISRVQIFFDASDVNGFQIQIFISISNKHADTGRKEF